jgi:ribonucleoside-diphosphate reductase alpha chain
MSQEAEKYVSTWVHGIDNPEWMKESGKITLASGYLLPGEKPIHAMRRIAFQAAKLLNKPHKEEKYFEALWKGWIGPSTPVWTNFGAERGLPIACFSSYMPDDLAGIFDTNSEIAMMSKLGGGTSSYVNDLRPRGAKIGKNQGKSDGPKSFLEIIDKTIGKVTQGTARRGAHASYMNATHPDISEFLTIKKPGDPVQDIFTGVVIEKDFINNLYNGDSLSRKTWAKILESRNQTGIPYITFKDNINYGPSTPEWYQGILKGNSNLCTEICLPISTEESFVCCLLSMNVAKWDEWKNTDAVELAVEILEAIMTEFINKARSVKHMERAVKFAENHRALGLGILGWHTYLKSKNQPFLGIFATSSTRVIMSHIKTQAEISSEKLAHEFGNAPFIEQYNKRTGHNIKRRHTTLLAIAPTTSNGDIQAASAGIEPTMANIYAYKGAKGNFIIKDEHLEKLLSSLDKNTKEVWDSIKDNGGSVQHLDFLSNEDKEVFLTFKEINQFGIIDQAALRQEYIDQSQSLNVNIPPDTDPKIVSRLYLYAYELGIKTLYYQRSESLTRSGLSTMEAESCVSCSG